MTNQQMEKRLSKLASLLEVGKAMTYERDLDRLLNLILKEVTNVMEADRSSLFLVDKDNEELWSKIAQGLEVKEIRIKIGEGIAGHVAATGKIINIEDAYQDPRFNKEVDRRTGYRTSSILCVPMINKLEDVIGVLQVLNKKEGIFTKDDEELLLAFSSQAAAAIENAILYEDIQKLFEGFIRASVYAIESRDPTTRGHSERVAVLTVALAEKVDRADSGPYAAVRFTPDEVKEIRYASILHDFGKVGVRENVLVKANKLYEPTLQLVLSRFGFIKKGLETETAQRKVDCLLRYGRNEALEKIAQLDRDLRKQLEEVDEFLKFILEVNKPTILPQGGFERLTEIAANNYAGVDGGIQPFLLPDEVSNLSIGKGSLNDQERQEIESHVTHTFHFLRQIPWTRDLKRVPLIAYSHHERLSGDGYPNRLVEPQIPIQARMMTVSDIYDALTASDRPYKKAVPTDKALDILNYEVRDNHIDKDLLQIFVEAKVFELVKTRQ